MSLLVGPAFGGLLYLQAGLHNPGAEAARTLLPLANELRFVCLSESSVGNAAGFPVKPWVREASSRGAI